MTEKLPPKRERFAAEYLVDLNATQAALRAGYSKRTAYAQGCRLLKDAEVLARITELQAARAAKVELDAEYVLRHLRQVAEQPDLKASAKVRAIELLGKHLGMFTDRTEVSVVALTPEERARRVAALIAKGNERGGEGTS